MADMMTEAAAETAPSRTRRRWLVPVLVLLVAGGAAAAFALGPWGDGAADEPEVPVVLHDGDVVVVGSMTTSLGGDTRAYARVELAVVLHPDAARTLVEPRFPVLRDGALTVIMGFRPSELRTVEGAERLRAELTDRAQQVWPDGEVLRVLVTDLVVQ
jgi:flagellar basal body-associated protein FliL